MEKERREDTAAIDRGEIARISGSGYIVKSYGRDGLVSPAIPAMGEATYQAGDKVYFFLFEDGDGRILGRM